MIKDAEKIKFQLFKKTKLKAIYPRYSKDKEHYYYIDNNNIEWCFTEINGTKENYQSI